MLNICICQIIRDEQRYLEEWINHYLNLGINKIILFEDVNSKSHKHITSKYKDVILYDNLYQIANDDEKTNYSLRQEIVWRCFYRLYKQTFDACLFVDADEYLDCDKNTFITEVEYYLHNPSIQFILYQWETMTASGHIKDPYPNQIYSLKDTYTKIMTSNFRDLNINKKSLIYLRKIKSHWDFHAPHGPWEGDNVVHSNIRLKHYLTKSWNEYKWRIYERGEPADEYYSKRIEHFFEINDDLIQYKEQLLNACKGLKSKHNINE